MFRDCSDLHVAIVIARLLTKIEFDNCTTFLNEDTYS